jgi:hypothetical protein
VRGADGTSWNNKRLPGVVFSFQVSQHIVEAHIDVPSNIFEHGPRRPDFSYKPNKFRPEVTVICLASSLPGNTEWLARIPSCDDVNMSHCSAI